MQPRHPNEANAFLDAKSIAETYAQLGAYAECQTWWRRNFYRFVLREICLEDCPIEQQLAARGLNRTTLANIAAWMNDLAVGDRRRRRLDRVSVPQARHFAENWQAAAFHQASPAEGTVTVREFTDGFHIVFLESDSARASEASQLRNCLGDVERFRASEIYSLRSPEGKPRVAIEILDGLLIQVRGQTNSSPHSRYHEHLFAFLESRGIPQDVIQSRLGLIAFDGALHSSLDTCVQAFFDWADTSANQEVLPFERHPMIREFLNIFARHGPSADLNLRSVVAERFTPCGPAWLLPREAKTHGPGDIRIHYPRLPAALLHLARYGAIPREPFLDVYRHALTELIAAAMAEASEIYDMRAENPILSTNLLEDLLKEAGLWPRYAAARSHARTIKYDAVKRDDVDVSVRQHSQESFEAPNSILLRQLSTDLLMI